MREKKYDFLLPQKGEDDRDSSLVVYTVTIAISIALLIWVITPVSTNNTGKIDYITIFATVFLTISTLLLFFAISILVDITSFAGYKSNLKHSTKVCKYKTVLVFYNLSIILIMISVLGVSLDYLIHTSLFICAWLWGIFGFVALYLMFYFGRDIYIVFKANIGPSKKIMP